MTSESHFPDGVWTVITLKSGAQIETLLTRCEVGHDENGHITSIQLTAHADSPTWVRDLNARSVDAIHHATEDMRGAQHTPVRGDAVEAWLKTRRDEQTTWSGRHLVDELLDTYRLHADTGTSLAQHTCEGRCDDCASGGTRSEQNHGPDTLAQASQDDLTAAHDATTCTSVACLACRVTQLERDIVDLRERLSDHVHGVERGRVVTVRMTPDTDH